MADMHRAGRVGRHIFQINGYAIADISHAISLARAENSWHQRRPDFCFERYIDKARPGDIGAFNICFGGQPVDNLRRQIARRHAGLLAQNHRRIGGNIAIRGIARRLDRYIVKADIGGQYASAL